MPGAGALDRRIIIQRQVETRDELNEPVQEWVTFITVWAGRKDASDGEKFAAGQVGSSLQTRFIIRYSTQSKTVSPIDRISYDSAIWNIEGIKETVEGRNRFLELSASKRSDP